jgi:hypothetical protein
LSLLFRSVFVINFLGFVVQLASISTKLPLGAYVGAIGFAKDGNFLHILFYLAHHLLGYFGRHCRATPGRHCKVLRAWRCKVKNASFSTPSSSTTTSSQLAPTACNSCGFGDLPSLDAFGWMSGSDGKSCYIGFDVSTNSRFALRMFVFAGHGASASNFVSVFFAHVEFE